jgi:hypothetical protein
MPLPARRLLFEPEFLQAFAPVFAEIGQQPFVREVKRMSILPVALHHLVQSIDDMLIVYLDR